MPSATIKNVYTHTSFRNRIKIQTSSVVLDRYGTEANIIIKEYIRYNIKNSARLWSIRHTPNA